MWLTIIMERLLLACDSSLLNSDCCFSRYSVHACMCVCVCACVCVCVCVVCVCMCDLTDSAGLERRGFLDLLQSGGEGAQR